MTTTRQMDNSAQVERYNVLKTMLEDRRREIQDKLRSLRETMPDEMDVVRDHEEQSVNDFVRDVDFALMQMKSDTLLGMDEALRRLEEGTYGVCSDCEAEIPEARLKALPFATRCRQCQEQVEAQQDEERAEGPAVGARLQHALALAMEREARHE